MLNLYKKKGETPLQRLKRLRQEKPQYGNSTLSYAGRLDPMAEGVLLVLVDDENKEREKYLNLDKEYLFKVLWAIETDTFDILGIPRVPKTLNNSQNINSKLQKIIENYKGEIIQKYPPYSSKPVSGKPLFQWAREERLEEIEIPKKEVEVYSIKLEDNYLISKEELQEQIKEKISLVKGDFRQKKVMDSWDKVLSSSVKELFFVSQIRISCSSGFYVRSFVDRLGKKLSTGAVTFEIIRTKVGNLVISESQ